VKYPFESPTFAFTHTKGLDDHQIEEIVGKLKQE
jgi:hypothetical protein